MYSLYKIEKKVDLNLTAFIKPIPMLVRGIFRFIEILTQLFFTPFLFIDYSKNNIQNEPHITSYHSENDKNGAYFQ